MPVMIDGLKLKIPFMLPKQGETITDDNGNTIIMASVDTEMNGYTINLENLAVNYWQQMKGDSEIFESIHKFESLASSYSGLAIKIVQDKECPCVWIFASPAKIMQGHNVYGTDNLKECSVAMLNVLRMNYPKLFNYLDLAKIDVQHIDVTASTQLSSEAELKQVLEFLGNVESGQTKQNNKKYQFTKYWGSDNSERKQLKIYAKSQEIDAYLKHVKKTLPDERFKAIARAHSPEVRGFAKNLLRFEARLKKKLIKEFLSITRLNDLIQYQRKSKKVLDHLWTRGFDDIMQALKGQKVTIHNDEEVLKKLKVAYRKITKTGKETYSKAEKLYGFYLALKDRGYHVVKCHYASSTFSRLKNDLIAGAGISQAHLQNLKSSSVTNVVPFIRYLQIDFDNQIPEGWIPPEPLTDNNVTYLKIA